MVSEEKNTPSPSDATAISNNGKSYDSTAENKADGDKSLNVSKHSAEETAAPPVHIASSKAAIKRKQNGNDKATQLVVKEQKKLAEEDKKISVLSKISLVWTVLSTIYAIASTCLYIWRGWVSNAVSYVLVAVLALYVVVFVVLIILTFRNPKKGKRNVKLYKKTLGIFKVIANIVYLVLTAISLAGLTHIGTGEVFRWIFFAISSLIAVIQLGLKVALLVLKVVRILIAKKFKVEVVKFIDGKKQKKSVRLKFEESKYKEE